MIYKIKQTISGKAYKNQALKILTFETRIFLCKHSIRAGARKHPGNHFKTGDAPMNITLIIHKEITCFFVSDIL